MLKSSFLLYIWQFTVFSIFQFPYNKSFTKFHTLKETVPGKRTFVIHSYFLLQQNVYFCFIRFGRQSTWRNDQASVQDQHGLKSLDERMTRCFKVCSAKTANIHFVECVRRRDRYAVMIDVLLFYSHFLPKQDVYFTIMVSHLMLSSKFTQRTSLK